MEPAGMSQAQAEEMLALMREQKEKEESQRGQWGPAMAALIGALVIVAVLILVAVRQV